MSEAPPAQRPRAENGVIFIGPFGDAQFELVSNRWKSATAQQLAEGLTRVDLSNAPRGECPGYNDDDMLRELSRSGPGIAFGFFCDGEGGAEGVRVFENGQSRDVRFVEWAAPEVPDSMSWPVASLALSLQIPLEVITRVERPPRPALAVAAEALLRGEEPETPELKHQALRLLGHVPHPEAGSALARVLKSPEWVDRFHAARAYAREPRGQGADGLPSLASIMDDEDESVREALLEGVIELLPQVGFQDAALHAQIDAAVKRGLADEDEDVQDTAARAQTLRQQLLG